MQLRPGTSIASALLLLQMIGNNRARLLHRTLLVAMQDPQFWCCKSRLTHYWCSWHLEVKPASAYCSYGTGRGYRRLTFHVHLRTALTAAVLKHCRSAAYCC